MNRLLMYLRGYWILTFRGAAPQRVLNLLTENRLPFWCAVWHDDFTVSIRVAKHKKRQFLFMIARCMCEIVGERECGLAADFGGVLKRPLLLGSIVIAFFLMLIVPQRVLFFHVVGNETVPTEEILWALDEIGVGFGISGVNIKPQWIKNRILSMIPDLEWITVTQNGCRAQVVVRERTHKPETEVRKGFANVVASKSGLITNQMVYAGQSMCEVGDIVAEGDLLVSGLVDLERTYSIVKADAEIYARTWYKKDAVSPVMTHKKHWTGRKMKTLWLIIGKKRIKIFGKSGISAGKYDKIITTKTLELPGGLTFPCSVMIETRREYIPVKTKMPQADVGMFLQQELRQSVKDNMIAGEILEEGYDLAVTSGVFRMTAELECHEMIASIIEAKWNQEDYFHDREVRKRGENGTDY